MAISITVSSSGQRDGCLSAVPFLAFCCAGPFTLRSQQDFEAHNQQAAPVGKRYFKHSRLADIIGAYPTKQGASDEEVARERAQREAFLDLLLGVLELEPSARWSPRQALQHPFFTGQDFLGPFQPEPDPLHSSGSSTPGSGTMPLQIPGGSPCHPAPPNGLYAPHGSSWQPGSWGASSGAVAMAGSLGPSSLGGSLGGLPGSWAMQAGSPAMHAQMHAHAAAMAALSHMSPQLSPMGGGVSSLAGAQPPGQPLPPVSHATSLPMTAGAPHQQPPPPLLPSSCRQALPQPTQNAPQTPGAHIVPLRLLPQPACPSHTHGKL